MGAELCSSPHLSVLFWDLARPLETLWSLAGALWKCAWPDAVPAYPEGLFLLLPGLVAVAACWSVLGVSGCSLSWLHIHPKGEMQAVSLAFETRSVEHANIENKCLFQLAALEVI